MHLLHSAAKRTIVLFGIELLLHRWGPSEFVFDEEEQVFRDRKGKALLSQPHANGDKLFGRDEHA